MRTMALDVGNKRIGVALSDPSGTLAQGVRVVLHHSREADAAALAVFAKENDVAEVVVGLPLLLSGKQGEQARSAKRLGAELGKVSGLPVVYWDERLTTAAAHRLMHEAGIPGRRHAERIDAAAAELILQGYLDWRKRE